jgi:hypothetical protein
MKRLFSTKSLVAAGLGLAAIVAASAAHARSDVYFSVGVHAPGGYGYVQPAPVYVQPRPVYVQPQPVYVQPQPVYGPAPIYDGQHWRHDGWGHDGRRWAHRYGPYGDLDRDGIANQYDRDRDGDGIRNRYDRFPQNPYRY